MLHNIYLYIQMVVIHCSIMHIVYIFTFTHFIFFIIFIYCSIFSEIQYLLCPICILFICSTVGPTVTEPISTQRTIKYSSSGDSDWLMVGKDSYLQVVVVRKQYVKRSLTECKYVKWFEGHSLHKVRLNP